MSYGFFKSNTSKIHAVFCAATLLALPTTALSQALCGRGGVVFSTKELKVDADGAPNSYLVNGEGLSYTCDGLTAVGSTPDTDPKGWQKKCQDAWKKAVATGDYSKVRIFGFSKDENNKPIIQKAGDPLPGKAFITETSVSVPDGPAGTQRHWVDATEIPYVVLSSSFVKKYGVKDGDIAVVYRPATKRFAYGVYADGGKLGEASVRFHQDIGNNPLVNRGGVLRAKSGIADQRKNKDPIPVITVVFPGKTSHPTIDAKKWRAEIAAMGKTHFDNWGGLQKLIECAR
ncbi:glycoside hydrolase family 75 protein [Agrobacterium tumefaciens]|uniref:glycoside hydrolase family 75 protein n=1 Tax=Agrobacterium tumefaciens TaxID=358 RepID=UPI00157596B0|nr:glycoside hydrolase family 75 protein [Agrobacterium tumefaciens]NTZ90045.1 hypothetical protein [Agrobacterium tumefaciens]